MSQQLNSSRLRACARRLSGYITVLAVLLLTLVAPNAHAQPTACNIVYAITPQNTSAFGAQVTIENTGTTGSVKGIAPGGSGSFTLNPSAATLSIAQSASGTDMITVTDVSPFSGS